MKLDHIAVAGATLEQAAAHVGDALGVALQPGGQHPMFGTHNHLLGLADGLYLEAIAIDPGAVPQRRPRWFDPDRFTGPPRLGTWICACNDLTGALADMPAGAGQPIALSRSDLRWRMAVPPDGILPFDNMFPALIEWQGGGHPATRLAQSGCALRRLVVSHPDASDLAALLGDRLSDARVVFDTGPPGMTAEIDTPHGLRVLR